MGKGCDLWGMKVIQKIEKMLAEKKVSQAALEREAMLSENRIAKLKESDGRLLKAWEALRIAKALGVPLEWLVDDEVQDLPAPAPQLTEPERIAALIVRQEGYDPETVYRLLRPGSSPGSQGHPVAPLAPLRTGHGRIVQEQPANPTPGKAGDHPGRRGTG
jgi:DNA-binding Xre family transcriptional regulator